MIYTMTDDDMHLANRMVAARKRTNGYKDSAELEGAIGEIAFARTFGLGVPEPVAIRSDGGFDFTLPSGATVDVKSISGPDSYRLGLLVPKRLRAGIYVLVHVHFGTDRPCTLLGWQTGGFAAANGQDKADHWRVHQRDLLPIEDLL